MDRETNGWVKETKQTASTAHESISLQVTAGC